ncbi:hypothetical protein GCM10009760_58940 [Kitasatospora kazusensis]|uniref:Uncharacterized protein n=1 Tax=Kitasatospora kazusensis TaxID=407974 RepID=A0ABN3A9Z3_9ACTN
MVLNAGRVFLRTAPHATADAEEAAARVLEPVPAAGAVALPGIRALPAGPPTAQE